MQSPWVALAAYWFIVWRHGRMGASFREKEVGVDRASLASGRGIGAGAMAGGHGHRARACYPGSGRPDGHAQCQLGACARGNQRPRWARLWLWASRSAAGWGVGAAAGPQSRRQLGADQLPLYPGMGAGRRRELAARHQRIAGHDRALAYAHPAPALLQHPRRPDIYSQRQLGGCRCRRWFCARWPRPGLRCHWHCLHR